MMSKKDSESFFRMALSRMQLALTEIQRIRVEVYDCPSLEEAEKSLEESIGYFILGRDVATGVLGFTPHESMPT
ncbi:MAG: hypothetical protein A4E20_10760 [Nitrospira sp. SG-bin2]|uniref:hypothetical protein n=1 Tax=Nitrospira cf. moscoviensis SBR1015 TaxID=96242 RepID=UPI000A0A2FE8|nr:hypothetical protein [Nitrospira cf. moscoviensis SBR1015]OQW34492.1 MAG: hypothetical protein A4E20_10760 [Nitrospira sp. SG-bin2]